jgi:hypothetical protein
MKVIISLSINVLKFEGKQEKDFVKPLSSLDWEETNDVLDMRQVLEEDPMFRQKLLNVENVSITKILFYLI